MARSNDARNGLPPGVVLAPTMPLESECLDVEFGCLFSQSSVNQQIKPYDTFIDTDIERTAREYKTRYIEVRPAVDGSDELKKYIARRKRHDRARRLLPTGQTPEGLAPEYANFIPLTKNDRKRNLSSVEADKPKKRWFILLRLEKSKMHRPRGGLRTSTSSSSSSGPEDVSKLFSMHNALLLNSSYDGELTKCVWKKLQIWTWNEQRHDYDKGELQSLPGDGEQVKVADLLVMSQSKYDNLMQPTAPYGPRPVHEMIAMNSCPTEPGGSFVLNGFRWCIVPQEMKSSFRVHKRIGKNGYEFCEFEGQTRDSNYRNDKVSIRGDRSISTREDSRGRSWYGGATAAGGGTSSTAKATRVSNLVVPFPQFDMHRLDREVSQLRPGVGVAHAPVMQFTEQETRDKLAQHVTQRIEQHLHKSQGTRPVIKIQLFITQKVILPIIIMFRAFGVVSYEDVLAHCRLDDDDDTVNRYKDDLMFSCCVDEGVATQEQALMRIGKLRTREVDDNSPQALIKSGVDFLADRFFRHLGVGHHPDFMHKKLAFLAYMTNAQLHIMAGIDTPTSRKSFEYRRLVLVREVMQMTFTPAYRDYMEAVVKELQFDIPFVMACSLKYYFENNPIITMQMRRPRSTRDGVKMAYSNTGILQRMDTLNPRVALSFLRRVNNKVSKHSDSSVRRKHQSGAGLICLIETPNGDKAGLVKALALLATASTGAQTEDVLPILEALRSCLHLPLSVVVDAPREFRPPPLPAKRARQASRALPRASTAGSNGKDEKVQDDMDETTDEDRTTDQHPLPRPIVTAKQLAELRAKGWIRRATYRVFFDGSWEGDLDYTHVPGFYAWLRSFKLDPRQPDGIREMSIVVDTKARELRVQTEPGRLMRWLWRLDVPTQRVMVPQELWLRWQEQRAERMAGRKALLSRLRDQTSAPVHMLWSPSELRYLEQCKQDWQLMVQRTCVERVDASEQIYVPMICPTMAILYGLHPDDDERRNSNKLYHYVTIHPAADYGITASLLVFSEFNMSQRNVYAVGQEKQQVAAESFQAHRHCSAPGSHRLTNAQRALIESHMAPMAYSNKLPGCQNAKVAFIHHDAKNQDDGLNASQTSIDLGMGTIESVSITSDITRPRRHDAILDLVRQIEVARSAKGHASHKRPKKAAAAASSTGNAVLPSLVKDALADSMVVASASSVSMRRPAVAPSASPGRSPSLPRSASAPEGWSMDPVEEMASPSSATGTSARREQAALAILDAARSFWDQNDVASTYLLEDEPHFVSREMYDQTGAGALTDDEKQQACRDRNVNPRTNLPIPGSIMCERDTVYRLVEIRPEDLTMVEKVLYMPTTARGRRSTASASASAANTVRGKVAIGQPAAPATVADLTGGALSTPSTGRRPTAAEVALQMALAKAKEMDEREKRAPRTRHLRNYINQPQETSVARVTSRLDARGQLMLRMALRQIRHPVAGDKWSTRAGQKGVLSHLYPRGRVPHLADGTFFDVARNPHGLSSRKTIGCLLESFYSTFVTQHPNYRCVGTGMSPSRISAFSSRFVHPTPWDEFIDPITRELLEMYNAPELGWLGYVEAESDADSVLSAAAALMETEGETTVSLPYVRLRLIGTIRKVSRLWCTAKHKQLLNELLQAEAQNARLLQEDQLLLEQLVAQWTQDILTDLRHVHRVPEHVVARLQPLMVQYYIRTMGSKLARLLQQTRQQMRDVARMTAVVTEALSLFHTKGYRSTHDPSMHVTAKSLFAQLDAERMKGVDRTQVAYDWRSTAPWKQPDAKGNLTDERIDQQLYELASRARIGMYSSETGELMQSDVTVGYIAMESLIKFSDVQAKACHRGKMDLINRQPVKSSLVNGSSRIGEMEAEGIDQHGAVHVRMSQMMRSSDVFAWIICTRCRTQAIVNYTTERCWCTVCKHGDKVRCVVLPYVSVLGREWLRFMNYVWMPVTGKPPKRYRLEGPEATTTPATPAAMFARGERARKRLRLAYAQTIETEDAARPLEDDDVVMEPAHDRDPQHHTIVRKLNRKSVLDCLPLIPEDE